MMIPRARRTCLCLLAMLQISAAQFPPVIGVNGTAYLFGTGGNSKKLFVVGAPTPGYSTGVLLWSYSAISGVVSSPPALGPNGSVYVRTDDGKLYVIGPPTPGYSTGILLWSYTTPG